LLLLLRSFQCRLLFSVVQLIVWWMTPGLFLTTCLVVFFQVLHLMHIKMVSMATSTAVQLQFWWHDGPPPERPPYIPKRRRRWKRLPEQFCQLLKSWIYTAYFLFKWTKISASDELAKPHLKLKGAIFELQNSRRLHVRKLLAFKHSSQAFS
jgi:hypothetical protein